MSMRGGEAQKHLATVSDVERAAGSIACGARQERQFGQK
jgi:hypothetical protein